MKQIRVSAANSGFRTRCLDEARREDVGVDSWPRRSSFQLERTLVGRRRCELVVAVQNRRLWHWRRW